MSKLNKVLELNTQEELLDTMDNKNSYNLEFEEVKNTPFTIVKKENDYFGVIGEHRITEMYENKEELIKNLTEFSWDRVSQVIWAITEKFNKNNEQIKQLIKDEQ